MILAASDTITHLVFPLVVLMVGAAVTGVLIPSLTRRRDSHRKALEIKTQLVSDISEAVMEFMMAVQFIVSTDDRDQPDEAAYKSWMIKRAVIGTKLEAYFPGTSLGEDWDRFVDHVIRFYELSRIQDPDHQAIQMTDLLNMYGLARADEEEADNTTQARLREAILEEKSVVIRTILSLPVGALEEPPRWTRVTGRISPS